MNILPGRESFFHVSCLGSYRASLGGPDEGGLRTYVPNPLIGELLRISPTNILLSRVIRQFVKEKLELIIREEIKNFLEIEQADTSNMRNGYYQRNLDTQYGRMEGLLVPRDRNGEFQTQLFAPYQRHTG